MKKIIGFVGGALVASALTFAGPAAAEVGASNAGSPWSAESVQKDASSVSGSAAAAIDLNAVTSYSLGW